MLNFFRKYQRAFFIVVTIVIILSFTFFGTYSASLAGSAEAPDRVICKGVQGKEITERELGALTRLIASSPLDREQGKVPNLLNDGVIQRDLLATGMGMMLARRYFDELKPDLESRLPRIKQYRPFVHPQVKEISAEAVWQRFHPVFNQHLALLKSKSDQVTMETLALLFQVYLDQAQFPEELVKQILVYQMNQMGMAADAMVQNADFSLFGFHTLEDWFGPRFVELASQFILNAAQCAQENGYKITNEEVRADLYQNIAHGYKEIAPQGALTVEEMQSYYQNEMHSLGLNESNAVQSWKQVMLFRRLFNDVGNSVFLDPLSFKQFLSFTKENTKVALYELPEALQLKDLRSVFRLQVYLDAVTQNPVKGNLLLSTRFAPIEQIEKRAPELIEQFFEIEYAQVEKEELARQISLKETWEWETEESSWETLKQQFPALAQEKVQTVTERFSVLDKLDANERLKIDQFARLHILDSQPEKLKNALALAELHTWSGGLRSKGGTHPFRGVKDQAALYNLLKSAPLANEEGTFPLQDKLSAFSQDGKTFTRIAVRQRHAERKMLTFASALRDGTLDQMLDAKLEAGYPEVRRKQAASFQQKDGSWRPFIEVKESVGKLVYADLLKTIEESYRSHFGNLPGTSVDLPSAFYTQHRLFSFVESVKQMVEKQEPNPLWVRREEQEGETAETQWQIISTERVIERSTALPFTKEKMFSLSANDWSPVEVGHSGALAFYQVLGKETSQISALEEMDEGHKALSLDARRSLMLTLMDQIQEKNAIHLTADKRESL
jgi:GcvH upstream region-like protein